MPEADEFEVALLKVRIPGIGYLVDDIVQMMSHAMTCVCLLYTSDAADDSTEV